MPFSSPATNSRQTDED